MRFAAVAVAALTFSVPSSGCLWEDCEYVHAEVSWRAPGLYDRLAPDVPVGGWPVASVVPPWAAGLAFAHPVLDEDWGAGTYWFHYASAPGSALRTGAWEPTFDLSEDGTAMASWPPDALRDVVHGRFLRFAENLTAATPAELESRFDYLWTHAAKSYALGGNALTATTPLPGPFRFGELYDKLAADPTLERRGPNPVAMMTDDWILSLATTWKVVRTSPRPPGGLMWITPDDTISYRLWLTADPDPVYVHLFVNRSMKHVAPDLPVPALAERTISHAYATASCREVDRGFDRWPRL